MIIDLKNIQTIYICPDHNVKYHNRKIHMETLLNKLNFTNIIHYKSFTNNYPECLNIALIDIFNKYTPPFLLLEDDIDINTEINLNDFVIDIPDNTDAFYLGLSNCAGDKFNNYDKGESTFKYVNNNILKVKNMLGGHAILYMNPIYTNRIKNTIISMPKKYYHDVVISRFQTEYNIYCFRTHYFYQSKKLNGHEVATKITIPNHRIENYPKNTNVTFVTCFVNINNLDYSAIETNYFQYFYKLVETDISIVLYIDKKYDKFEEYIQKYTNLQIRYIDKDTLWINKINKKLPIVRNIAKDNENYLKLMNYKIFFIQNAIIENIYNTTH
jgi:hypothetical protein